MSAVMPKRILVVDDNEDNRQILIDLLSGAGYEVIVALTGLDAVAIATREVPALVLMDIQLPGIDGITAFRQIREDPTTATIPAIAVTASVMDRDRQAVMAAGFDGYQSKPLEVKAFVEAVRRMLDR